MIKQTYNRIRKLIKRDKLDSALNELSVLLKYSSKLDETIRQTGLYEDIRTQIILRTDDHSGAILTQPQNRTRLLDFLHEIEIQSKNPDFHAEIERAITIIQSKNVINSSNISAGGNIHIGDIYNNSGNIDWNTLYDKVYIFHAETEEEWVRQTLIPKLRSIGLQIHLDLRKPTLENYSDLGRIVAHCKATLIIFPKNFTQNEITFLQSIVSAGLKNLIAIRLDEYPVLDIFSTIIALSSIDGSSEHFHQLFAQLDSENFPIYPELDERFIEISSMPNGGEHIHLFGRQRELQILDDAWAKRKHRILCFVAQGGVGKSALFNRWLEDMRRDNFRGAGRVLATSFYSQGTGERVTSAEQFINFALGWFGESNFEQRSPWDKGKRLAHLISQHNTLLVLDGLEPLQEGGAVETGKVKDPALFTLIRDLAKYNDGLCIITSRLKLSGMKRQATGIRHEDLDQISDEAGKHILRFARIQGDDIALIEAVKRFGNHAFALNLLGSWLYSQPGHRIEAVSEIADLPGVPLEYGKHARRVIAAFEKQLQKEGFSEEVRLLRFLGLFDRSVSEEVISQLYPFQNLYRTLDRLWMLKLIYREKRHPILRKNMEDMVDCHPVVREHYSEVFMKEEPKTWQECHSKLYDYYKGLPERLFEKRLPDSFEEMEPLFLAVGHGKNGGRILEAIEDVYWVRICREKDESYFIQNFGAYQTDLAMISHFFDEIWHYPSPNLPDYWQSMVLNWAGYNHLALGNLKEAYSCTFESCNRFIAIQEWKEASANFSNMSIISSLLGNLKQAKIYIKESLAYAEMTSDNLFMKDRRTVYGELLFNCGDVKSACEQFILAEELQNNIRPNVRYLWSLGNFRYCQIFLEEGNFEQVILRCKENIKIEELGWLSILDKALNRLLLNMAINNSIEPKFESSDASFIIPIDLLRRSGRIDYLPYGLLARASFYRKAQKYQAAETDLEEVFDIAESSSMRLHLTDYYLEKARLYIAKKLIDVASTYVSRAAHLITQTGYHRRDKELEQLIALIEASKTGK